MVHLGTLFIGIIFLILGLIFLIKNKTLPLYWYYGWVVKREKVLGYLRIKNIVYGIITLIVGIGLIIISFLV